MPPIINIAAYKFAELEDLGELRGELRAFCKSLQLKGTILISPEGINLFIAGSREGIDSLLERLRQIPGLVDLKVKESLSDTQPFNRMLVRIKREIIAFGVEGIAPQKYTSRRLPARELKQWLDEGRPVTLLDTRNNFELEAGTFENAVAIDVDSFRDFPQAVSLLPEEMKQQPIVTFCTGGIRCEKAAPYMEREGFADVYQLEGGILKYFEECGGEHYNGECFVFDQRVTLDPELKESVAEQCFACQATLSPEDQASPKYVAGESCPYCYQSETEAHAQLIERRHAAIRKATTPLPGSIPYDNVRPITVALRYDGMELLDFLDAIHTQPSREEWERICADGQLACRDEPVHPGRTLRAGERLEHLMPATYEPNVNARIEILYEDDAIVVVNKPAPLPMHPCGRFNRNSLSYILGQAYAPLCLRPAHRLDADTSGLVLFSKTRRIAGQVQPQFQTSSVSKTYLARVQRRPTETSFECHSPISAVPDTRGIRLPDPGGSAASTHFRVTGEFNDGTTLLEIQPITGRTNQIRIHLWELGFPIVGDPIYLPNRETGNAKTLSITDPPLCLHATALEFTHPRTKECVNFKAPAPRWTIEEKSSPVH